MIIEVGDVFITRGGDLAVVTELRNESGLITFPIVGMVFESDTLEALSDEAGRTHSWTAQGRYSEIVEYVRDLAEKLADDDPRVPILRALVALEGYSHGN